MKRLSVYLILMLVPFFLNAQIRNYVGVVEEQYHPEIVSFLEGYRDELSKNGFSTYAKYIDSYLEGGFGSGFVYVDTDGTNYVITNRHVVSQAATASIQFEDAETGDIKKYEGLTVVAFDDDIDLAILKFKDNAKPFRTGIPLSRVTLRDGQDVWSAGFPGLGGEPVWQLGKGSVTNARARIKELLDPAISTIIQHSAEIDSGNSGGPLLISANNSVGYEVVGVNTWKAVSRQNTNFAIPASLILPMIRKVSSTNAESDLASVKSRSEKFIEILNNKDEDFTSLAKYISDEMTLAYGKKDFTAAVKYATSSARNLIAEAFVYSPLEGMRYAVAYQLWSKFAVASHEEKVLSIALAEMKTDYDVMVLVAGSENPVNVLWMKEKGIWRLKSMAYNGQEPVETKKSGSDKKKVSGSGIEIPSVLNIYGAPTFTPDFDIHGFSIGLDAWALAQGYLGMSLYYNGTFTPGDLFSQMGFGLCVRLPYNYEGYFNVDLVGKAGISYSMFSGTDFYIGYVVEGGLEFLYTNGIDFKPGVGISYAFGNAVAKDFYEKKYFGTDEIRIYAIFAF